MGSQCGRSPPFHPFSACVGTTSAFFRGNGTNVIKIAPETAIKLSCNDRIKHWVCEDIEEITPAQRMLSGALAGAVAQVGFRVHRF